MEFIAPAMSCVVKRSTPRDTSRSAVAAGRSFFDATLPPVPCTFDARSAAPLVGQFWVSPLKQRPALHRLVTAAGALSRAEWSNKTLLHMPAARAPARRGLCQ
ncbi:unnamed protein product [Symbiodinium natans]|uniref:Uncharacterized protein n=1 Tax=Symbiodinium natans TaxID=878477 RepID=A0A812SBV3_9DINO|nr:unnamed protein product [Symbiodinium natans]